MSTELSWLKSHFVELKKKREVYMLVIKLISEYQTKVAFSLQIIFKNKLDHTISEHKSQNVTSSPDRQDG
jgi:hypothetical protein